MHVFCLLETPLAEFIASILVAIACLVRKQTNKVNPLSSDEVSDCATNTIVQKPRQKFLCAIFVELCANQLSPRFSPEEIFLAAKVVLVLTTQGSYFSDQERQRKTWELGHP